MAEVKIETTVRRAHGPDGISKPTNTDVVFEETRDVTLERELEDIEDVMWALEARDHEVVYSLWEEQLGDHWDGWTWYGYPKGDVTVSLDSASIFGITTERDDRYTTHEVVEYIVERDDVDDPAGVYLDLECHPRIPEGSTMMNTVRGAFIRYLAEERGVDTSYWTHGHSAE